MIHPIFDGHLIKRVNCFSRGDPCKKPDVKYAFMHSNTGEFSIKAQCEVFGVSRSGCYAWRRRWRNPSRRQMEREKLDNLVIQAFETRKERSGAVLAHGGGLGHG